MDTISNNVNVSRILVDSSYNSDKLKNNVISDWKATFVLSLKDQFLNVSENVIYFKYEFSQNWFGPYFGISMLFDSKTYTKNKKIIDEHDSITVTFEDRRTEPFKFTFVPAKQAEIKHQDISSNGESIGSMHMVVRTYYPKILFLLETTPVVDTKKQIPSVSTMKKILQNHNIVLVTTPSVEPTVNSFRDVTIKSSNIKEALLNIAHNLRYGNQVISKHVEIKNSIAGKYLSKTYENFDENVYYPFRLSTNTTGTTLILSFYLDMLKLMYFDTALIFSFTCNDIDYDMLTNASNYKFVSIMSSQVEYSSGWATDYLKNGDNYIISTSFSYYDQCIITVKKTIREIALLPYFGNMNNLLVNVPVLDESKILNKTNCKYDTRQSHSTNILKDFLQCGKIFFIPTSGLLPTSFFTSNFGFVIWTTMFNMFHVANENKLTSVAGIEQLQMPSQLCYIKLEGIPVEGNPSLMYLKQVLGLSRPLYV